MTQQDQTGRSITLRLVRGTIEIELDKQTELLFTCSMANGVTGIAPKGHPGNLNELPLDPDNNTINLKDGTPIALIVGRYKLNPKTRCNGRILEIPVHEHHVWTGEDLGQVGTVRIKLVKKVEDKALDNDEKRAKQLEADEAELKALQDACSSLQDLAGGDPNKMEAIFMAMLALQELQEELEETARQLYQEAEEAYNKASSEEEKQALEKEFSAKLEELKQKFEAKAEELLAKYPELRQDESAEESQ